MSAELLVHLATVTGALTGLSLIWFGLRAAERRGWIRLRGRAKGSAVLAFAAVEDMFAPSRSRPREVQQEQQRIGAPMAPIPGGDDGDDDDLVRDPGHDRGRGRYTARITLPPPSS